MLGFRAIARGALSAILKLGGGATINAPSHNIVFTTDAPTVATGAEVELPDHLIRVFNDAPTIKTEAPIPSQVTVLYSGVPTIASGSSVNAPSSSIVTASSAFEINARYRRVKYQIVQS